MKLVPQCLLLYAFLNRIYLTFSLSFYKPRKTDDIDQLIRYLPKLELHAHLHGSVRHATLLELIQQRNASSSMLKFVLDENDHGLPDRPFDLFPIVHKMVSSIAVVKRILNEMVEDYVEESTIYLEIRSSPRSLDDGISVKEYIRTIVQEIGELNRKFSNKILIKYVVGIDRSKNVNDAYDIYGHAKELQYYRGEKIIVGIDFSGNPNGGRFDDYQSLFQEIKDYRKFYITIHTAEGKELSEPTKVELEDDETSKIMKFL
jgi:adenosine deaminase